MPTHSHAESELALVLSGQVQAKCGRTEIQAGANTLAYTPPELAHSTNYLTEVRAFYISIRQSAWERLGASSPNLASMVDFCRATELQLAYRMLEEYRRADSFSAMMLEGLMLQLMATIARGPECFKEQGIPKWLLNARDYLHANFTQSPSLTSIAKVAGVHPGHLMRTFQLHFGESMGSYLRRLRIETACTRISCLSAEESLGSLAAELGYADQSQFTRTFKKIMGQTPMQYRKSLLR